MVLAFKMAYEGQKQILIGEKLSHQGISYEGALIHQISKKGM